MKTNFFLILLIILIILSISLFYLVLLKKEKMVDSEIENEYKKNHNLKILLDSKLSIFNLSKNLENENLRPLNENDIIYLQKDSSEKSLEEKNKK